MREPVDLAAAALHVHRPASALRAWIRRGRLTPRACDTRTRRLLFELTDVEAADAASMTRDQAAAAARQAAATRQNRRILTNTGL